MSQSHSASPLLGSRAGTRWLFAGLLALQLLPVWFFPCFPSQDGPAHQAMADLLRRAPHSPLVGQYFQASPLVGQNGLIHWLMAAMPLSLPLAEKVVLSLYVLLLPLAALSALRGVNPNAEFLAVLALPFTFNLLCHLGFFNFCLGLPAFLFTVGYAWRRRNLSPGGAAGLAALAIVTYLCHPVALAMALAAVMLVAGWCALLDAWPGEREGRPQRLAGLLARRVLLPAAAFLPPVLLVLSFLTHHTGGPVEYLSLGTHLRQLAGLYSLVSLEPWTLALALLLAALFAALTIAALHQRRGQPPRPADAFLVVALAFGVLYLAAPSTLSRGGYVSHRLALFPFLALLLWLAAGSYGPRLRSGITVAGAALTVGWLLLLWPRYAALNRDLAEYLSAAPQLEPDHTLLALSFDSSGHTADGSPLAFRTQPFLHAQGYLTSRCRLVDLALYSAGEDYFPLRYRPERNPYRFIGPDLGLEREPPRVDFLSYPQRTGGKVDYVLLWARKSAPDTAPEVQSILHQLAAGGYDSVYRSPQGNLELYRQRSPLMARRG